MSKLFGRCRLMAERLEYDNHEPHGIASRQGALPARNQYFQASRLRSA